MAHNISHQFEDLLTVQEVLKEEVPWIQAVKHNKVDCTAIDCNFTPFGAPDKPGPALAPATV